MSGPVSDLLLSDLPLIEDLDGLEQITDADFVVISRNDALLSLDGLQGLESVRLLTISNNDSLTTFGNMRRLASVEYLSVLLNPGLEEVDGLAGVSGPISLLHVEGNDQLKDVDGLSGLTEAAVVELGSNSVAVEHCGTLQPAVGSGCVHLRASPAVC